MGKMAQRDAPRLETMRTNALTRTVITIGLLLACSNVPGIPVKQSQPEFSFDPPSNTLPPTVPLKPPVEGSGFEASPPGTLTTFFTSFDQSTLRLVRGKQVGDWNNVLRFRRVLDQSQLEPDRFEAKGMKPGEFEITVQRALPGVYWLRVWPKASSALGWQQVRVQARVGAEVQEARLDVFVQGEGIDQFNCLPDPCKTDSGSDSANTVTPNPILNDWYWLPLWSR
jgi:hypothetical protein